MNDLYFTEENFYPVDTLAITESTVSPYCTDIANSVLKQKLDNTPVIQLWKDADGEWKGQEDKNGMVFGATHIARLVDITEL